MFQFRDHARDAVSQLLRAQTLAKPFHHERKGERRRAFERPQVESLLLQLGKRGTEPLHVELVAQHFLLCLRQQQIVGVVFAEHVVVQARRGLQLPRAFGLTRVARKHQPRDARDLAKAALRQLAGIEAGHDVVQQRGGGEGFRTQVVRPVDRGRGQQLEAIVVDRDRKRAGPVPADAPGQQAGQPQVHVASGVRIKEQVPPFARHPCFGQQRAARGQRGPALLQHQQGLHALHLGSVEMPVRCRIQPRDDGAGEFVRQGHAPAVPARHRGLAPFRGSHIGGHLEHAHQLQQAAAEQQVVTRLEPRNETLLDRTQALASAALAPELHRHAGVADDGADAHAVPTCQMRRGHTPYAVLVGRDAVIVRIRAERCATVSHEGQ